MRSGTTARSADPRRITQLMISRSCAAFSRRTSGRSYRRLFVLFLHTVVTLALCPSLLLPVPLVVTSHMHKRANTIAEEKLRQRGIHVGAAPDLQQPLEAPVQARQPRIEEFFPRAVQG